MSSSAIGNILTFGATGNRGPIGPTGATGATGSGGSTGATGNRAVYIVSGVNNTQGLLFTLSDSTTIQVNGNFRGATLEENVTSASNVGSGEEIFKQLVSGQLEFRGLTASGSLLLTQDSNNIIISSTYEEGVGSLGTLVDDTILYISEPGVASSTGIKTNSEHPGVIDLEILDHDI